MALIIYNEMNPFKFTINFVWDAFSLQITGSIETVKHIISYICEANEFLSYWTAFRNQPVL